MVLWWSGLNCHLQHWHLIWVLVINESRLLHLQSRSLIMCLGKQWKMAQLLGPLNLQKHLALGKLSSSHWCHLESKSMDGRFTFFLPLFFEYMKNFFEKKKKIRMARQWILAQQLRCTLEYQHPISELPGFEFCFHFQFQLPTDVYPRKQQMMAQVVGSLPPVWHVWFHGSWHRPGIGLAGADS